MKVTFISSLPPLKGISKYTAALLNGLPKDIDVDAINFKRMYPEFLYPGDTKDESLKQISLPNVDVRTFLTWYNPLSWIYAGLTVKGDIVHAQWWSYVLAPIYFTVLLLMKVIKRKKIILTVHNVKPHETGKLKSLANKSILNLADHYIVHSEKNKQTLMGGFKMSDRDVSVVPHGVLLPDAPRRGVTKKEARELLDINTDNDVLLFFGIIREYKGLDILIKALDESKKQNKNVTLLIAGKAWEDWGKYKRLISEYGLASSVRSNLSFIPEDEVEIYFAAADVVVLPYTHFDAQSGAGSLALPYGKPLIVTQTGSLPQLVKDRRAVVVPSDEKSLADSIVNIFSSQELRNKLSNDSLKLAKELSWDRIGKQTEKIYEKVLSSNTR